MSGLLLLLPLTLLLALAEHRGRQRLRQLGMPPGGGRWLAELAALAALALLLWPRPQAVDSRSAVDSPAIALAVDVSASMAAGDLAPNRLDRARSEIRALAAGLPGSRFALVPFAGEATLQVPLTADREALLYFVDRLETGTVAAPGSAPEEGVAAACRALAGASGNRAVILFSDGERTVPWPPPVISSGIPVYVVPLGTEAGDAVPEQSGTPYLDESGQAAVSRLDPQRLRQIAAATGGEVLDADTRAIAPLLARWGQTPSAGMKSAAELTLWLAAALLLARHLPRPRRFTATALLVCLLLACGQDSGEGRRLFVEAERLAAAQQTPEAVQRFARAARLLDGEARGVALYNRGTLLLNSGDPVQAIPPLEEALVLIPGDESVRRNLVLALRAAGDRRPPGIGEHENGRAEGGGGLDRDQALQLLESVRPDPAAPAASRARASETPVPRGW